MIIIAFLAVLFAIFFLMRRHIGAALLATLAGLSVYEMFGKDIVSLIAKAAENFPTANLEAIVFLVLVLIFPLVSYFRSGHGGLFGLLRIAEAAAFAAILASLCAPHIATFLSLDDLSGQILSFISSIKGPLLMGGIVAAYFDILFYRD